MRLLGAYIWWKRSWMYKALFKDYMKLLNTYVIDDVCVCTYEIQHDGETRRMNVIMRKPLQTNASKLERALLDSYNLRNTIVHCSMSNDKTDALLDLTSDFRMFTYHFDKDDDVSAIHYFLKYVEGLYKLEFSTDWELVVYMNDNVFTEKRFKLHDALRATFKSVLYEDWIDN